MKGKLLIGVFAATLCASPALAQWSDLGGGDHDGGDWIPAPDASISGFHYNVGAFTVPSGATVYVDDSPGNPNAGTLRVACGSADVSGTLDGAGKGFPGGAGGPGGPAGSTNPLRAYLPQDAGSAGAGFGPGGAAANPATPPSGSLDSSAGGGGGGASHAGPGGTGGPGGAYQVAVTSGGAGSPLLYDPGTSWFCSLPDAGSGGGGGSGGDGWSSNSGGNGGNGGNGGAVVWIEADQNIAVSGTILASGSFGLDATDGGGSGKYEANGGGGGGGGAGGAIALIAGGGLTLAPGSLQANGGNGGAGGGGYDVGGGGGGGGGGWILLAAPDAGGWPAPAGGIGGLPQPSSDAGQGPGIDGSPGMSLSDAVPDQALNVSPPNGASVATSTPTLVGSGGSSGPSQWRLWDALAGAPWAPLWTTTLSGSPAAGATVPSGLLSSGTTYGWSVRSQGANCTWSAWSTETDFTPIQTADAGGSDAGADAGQDAGSGSGGDAGTDGGSGSGIPAQVAFDQQPTDTQVGAIITPPVTVQVLDAQGSPIITSSARVTVGLGNNPGLGTLYGTVTTSAVNGVATFSDLSIHSVGQGYTLVATAQGLLPGTSNSFNITAISSDGGLDAGAGSDAGVDAGTLDDAGTDAGTLDAGTDAGTLDAGTDAGTLDAGTDAGTLDAGTDAGRDAGSDAGLDAGRPDAGSLSDAGATPDSGVSADAGDYTPGLAADLGCGCGSAPQAFELTALAALALALRRRKKSSP